ncbi:Ig-like domain-containing protein [candidate division KSB1 bacterium]|nr:Ig-like domain-containing protein [candidate division KSB1 bacterium]
MFKSRYIFIVLVLFTAVSAQTPPDHTRLIFSDDLTSGGTKPIGQIINTDGLFTADGWVTQEGTSQLRINLAEFLPFEGTVIVKIKGFNPQNINFSNFDWAPLSLWSRASGDIFDVGTSPGSYVYIKSDQGLNDGNRTGFILWTSPFWGDVSNYTKPKFKKTYPVAKILWDPSIEYTWKVIWGRPKNQPDSKTYLWLVVTDNQGEVVAQGQKVHLFDVDDFQKALVESFGYIYLGRDARYSAIPEIRYSGLKVYAPDTDIPFVDVAKSHNISADLMIGSQGLVISDINNDHFEDIYIPRYHKAAANQKNFHFVRQEDGTFKDEAQSRATAGNVGTYAAVHADFDNDGDQDLFVGNSQQQNTLLFNNGNGSYSDVTNSSGILNVARYTNGITVLDIENDGDYDIVAVNAFAEHEVYVNDGNGNFSAQDRGFATFTGVTGAPMEGIVSGDLNNDNYQDLVLVCYAGPSLLFFNDGYGSFNEVSTTHGFDLNTTATTATIGDIDNDGDQDILAAISVDNNDTDPAIVIYRNNGAGHFTKEIDPDLTANTHGILLGDYDNDGDKDIFAISKFERPSKVYKNDGNGNFSREYGTSAEVQFTDGRGSGNLDFDDDGDLDIFAVSRGGVEDNKPYSRNYLLSNQSANENHFLKVAVYNDEEGYAGLGAKIAIYETGYMDDPNHLITFHEINAVSAYFSQSSWIQHLGVGPNNVVNVKIIMPNGKQKIFNNQPTDQLLEVWPSQVIPTKLQVTGCDQQGKAGEPLNDQISARVEDDEGSPVSGIPVQFELTSGNGTLNGTTLSSVTVSTGIDGRANVTWHMGTVAGIENVIQVSAEYNGGALVGSPTICSITPEPGDPDILIEISGNNQNGYVNEELELPLKVRVTDSFDNNIQDQAVSFQVNTGNGTLNGPFAESIDLVTDDQGLAQVNWHLGPDEGMQTVRVISRNNGVHINNSPLVFRATAEAPQRTMSLVSGNNQTGTVNTQLNSPFVIKLEDNVGSPVVGESITFNVLSGNGSFSNQQSVVVQTNSLGRASATATLGTVAGDTNNVFFASVPAAAGSPVEFRASATAGPVSKLEEVSGNGQTGPINRILSDPFVVRVMDGYNNPIDNHEVKFQVTAGDGTINNQKEVKVTTNPDGEAFVFLRLGTKVGTNTVQATSASLPGTVVNFNAASDPGGPVRIDIVSGDNQIGDPGQLLPQQLAVAVRDSFFNPIPEHAVAFSVVSGGGHINGQTTVERITNLFGEASVPFTLGTTEYLHQVRATSYYMGTHLINSPVVFNATTGPGEPDSLYLVSGNNQIGGINRPLPEPFVVRVIDEHGIPVADHEIQFTSYTQGAHFDGSPNTTKRTDQDGYALVTATIGSDIGNNIYVFEAFATYEGRQLGGSPLQIYASGRLSTAIKMKYTSGDSAVGIVGTTLYDPLKVKILDAGDQPVADHPVEFVLLSGDSLLDGSSTSVTKMSDQNGIAQVTVLFGAKPGTTRVRATSDDGMAYLQGSPVNFIVSSVPGPPSAKRSTLNATSPVTANGQDLSTITVTLMDQFGNRLQKKTVTLFASGINVNLTQPSGQSNSAGQVMGYMSSLNVGKAMVWGICDNQTLPSDTVRFKTGPPHTVIPFNSDQIAEIGKLLDKPIGLTIYDAWNHPIENVQVTFIIKTGQGRFLEPQPVYTNSEGKVSVHWELGLQIGEQTAIARIAGLPTEIEFTAYAIPPNPASITRLSGNEQIGLINSDLAEPLVVSVKDSSGNPIPGIAVNYELIVGIGLGQGDFVTSNPATTETNGHASVRFKAGSLTGEHRVRASLPSFSGIFTDFDFIIQAQKTVYLQKINGDHQTVRPQTNLQIGVKVTDYYDRPAQNEKIQFQTTQGDGGYIVTSQPILTNSTGIAIANWMTGLNGEQAAQAQPVEAAGGPVIFTATVINSPPVITSPVAGAINLDAGSSLSFVVTASDAENDVISYGVRGLPVNATFDSTGTLTFFWIPTSEQAGVHTIKFVVEDQYGASSSVEIQINVIAVNRCPQITAFQPPSHIVDLRYNEMKTFRIAGDDDDGDELKYQWWVNEYFGGENDSLRTLFTQEAFPDPQVTVLGIISDGVCSDTVEWQVRLSTNIELVSFEALQENNNIKLNWKTGNERNNLGFNILRGERPAGPYRQLNLSLIPTSPTGSYQYTDHSIQAGIMYYYKLVDVDKSGLTAEHGPVMIEIAMPKEVMLAQNYPNPFNPTTTIYFELPESGPVKLQLFNITGQIVRTLINGNTQAGMHKIIWDATDEQGNKVPSGLYYYQLITKDKTFHKKLVLLK